MLGSSTGIYTIITFYLDQFDELKAVFSKDNLDSLDAQSEFFEDFIRNIVNKKGDLNTKVLNNVRDTIANEDQVNELIQQLCEFLAIKKAAGEI